MNCSWLFQSTPDQINLGLTFIRIAVGLIFIRHGFPKMYKGIGEWKWLGDAMGYLGIKFWPVAWGIAAASAEFFGGIFLALGLGTRIAAFFIGCVMAVATNMHYRKGDTWGWISHPLLILMVMIGFIIAGGGSYSLDQYYM